MNPGGTGSGLSRLWGSLVAAKLIDNNEKVFAYTFAAPGTIENTDGAPHAAKYDSIFNIVNEDDFIPYFPLKQWYFTRYGRTTQNVSISSGYSTIWANSWEDYQKNDVTRTYMHMSSPTTPLAEFYSVAGSRNACYEYGPDYPPNDFLKIPSLAQITAQCIIAVFVSILAGLFICKTRVWLLSLPVQFLLGYLAFYLLYPDVILTIKWIGSQIVAQFPGVVIGLFIRYLIRKRRARKQPTPA